MGRYLARALAALETPAHAEAAPPANRGFGGFGGFGERVEIRNAPLPDDPRLGFGGFGGFGDAAENENQPPKVSPWPEGVDFHLTRDAARISGLISSGCEWRWCPDGGLDVVKDDGLTLCLSPSYSRRLQAGHLLPADVLEAAP